MSVRGTLGGIFASVAVLIVGWQIGAAALAQPTSSTTTSSGSGTGTGGSGSSGSSSSGTSSSGSSSDSSTPSPTASADSGSSSSSTTTSSGLKDGTYTGTAVQTRYGIIQVQATVSGGKITNVTTPQLQAFDGRSQYINSQAVPLLKQEVLSAQSAQVDTISGATYTSEGYLTSLQAALDKAK